MKAPTRGQVTEMIARFATQVNWDAIDGDVLQRQFISLPPKEFGERFNVLLKNGGRGSIGEPKVIPIDRTNPFDPVPFIGNDSSIVEVEQDKRSLKLFGVNLTKVKLQTTLKTGEKMVTVEEILKCLIASGVILLDAKVFQTLWENKALIPESWKQLIDGKTTFVLFPGTVLRDSDSRGFVLCLFWFCGEWSWSCLWLGSGCGANSLSAVLES